MEEKEIILKADNISKQYRLGVVGTGTLSHDLNKWWYKIRGKKNPYLKVGEVSFSGFSNKRPCFVICAPLALKSVSQFSLL